MLFRSEKPLLKKFLSAQLINIAIEDQEGVEARTEFWWCIWYLLGSLAAIFGMGTISSWILTFKITTILIGVAFVIFMSGFTFYHHETPMGSPLTTIYRVLKAAILKRHLLYPRNPNDYYENDTNDIQFFPKIRLLRCVFSLSLSLSLSLSFPIRRSTYICICDFAILFYSMLSDYTNKIE